MRCGDFSPNLVALLCFEDSSGFEFLKFLIIFISVLVTAAFIWYGIFFWYVELIYDAVIGMDCRSCEYPEM